jgi:multiple sugar transport system substrate-binding protein
MTDPASRKTFRIRLEHMIATLRGDIITGKRRPGEFLPTEREMSKQFQLSNKLVRAGLERLVGEGLIEKIARIGNRVAEHLPELAVSLKFGYPSSLDREAELAELIRMFHREYPSVHVQPIPIAFDKYYDTVKEYLEAGLLDLVAMNYNNFHDFRRRGRLDLLQEFDRDETVYPFLADAFVSGDKQYVRPFIFSPLVLCYNLDHLRDAGLPVPYRPDSWTRLLEDASRLTVENERFGFYFFLHSKNRWPVFVLQSGDVPGQAGTVGERLMEGLNVCREIINAPNTFPTFLSGSDADAEELFAQGKVSVIMTSYMAMNHLRGTGVPFDIAPLPKLKEEATILMTIGVAVNKRSESIAAARAFADFMLSDQAQSELRRKTLSIPAVPQAAEWQGEESMYRPPGFLLFRELVPALRLFTDLNLTVEQMDAVIKEARLYWAKLQSEKGMRGKIADILSRG